MKLYTFRNHGFAILKNTHLWDNWLDFSSDSTFENTPFIAFMVTDSKGVRHD